MKQYSIEVKNEASLDLNEIYASVLYTSKSIDIANKQYKKIKKAILSLNIFPYRFKNTGFVVKTGEEIRVLSINHYFVFYTITGDKVNVLSVCHDSFDITRKLKYLS